MSHKENAELLRHAAKELLEIDAPEPAHAGLKFAAKHLRSMAQLSHNAHKKQIEIERQNRRDANAKARAFGFGG